jgi:hypothetical protein
MNLKSSVRASWETVAARRWFCFLPFALGAFFGAPSFSAASGAEELMAFRGIKSAPNPFHHARHGMPRFDVLVAVGPPDHKLGPDVWVYWNVKSNQPGDTERGYDAMVLRFTKDKLSEMRLVESGALRSLIVSLAAKPSPPIAKR